MNHIEVSKQILELIGSEKNVQNFTHCVTRLRFNVRDKSLVKVDEVNKIKGIMGSQWQGEQFQIIVGPEVEKLYSTLCKLGNFEKRTQVNEILDSDMVKKKTTARDVVDKVFAYLSPMMSSLIPLMVAAGLCKVIAYLFGPDLLDLMKADSGTYLMLDFIYDAFFYFMPVYLGYVAGKTLGYNPLYGMFLGTLIIVPDFINLVGVQDKIVVLGLPVPVSSYSGSFLPVVLGGVICKYVLDFMEKYIPTVLKTLLVPFLTTIIMTLVMFVVCAPLGTYIGIGMGNFFMALSNGDSIVRVIGSVIITVAWPFMILFGMHGWSFAFSFALIEQYGFDPFIFSTAYVANIAIYGMALGAALKLKNKENKTLTLNYFLTSSLGGMSEPILYGVLVKYKNAAKGLIASCAIGGLLCGILVPKLYVYTTTSLLGMWACWMTDSGTSNLIIGNVILAITFISAVIATYLQKFDEGE